ncbi:MAG: hypothetical protein Tsb0014_05250 [Pleurocapsa sp.]
MNRQTRRSLEPPAIHQRTQKQQILCDAIKQNYPTLENTIKARVSKTIKDFGHKFDLSHNSNSINTITTEILQNTVETVLNKSEEFNLNKSAFPWILQIAMYKYKGWQRDTTRSSERVIPIKKFAPYYENSSEEEILGRLTKSSPSSNSEEPMMLEYLLSLVNESDRQVLKLAFIDDLNGEDLAAALGVSEGSAYTKKHRALTRLKKAYIQANPSFQEDK